MITQPVRVTAGRVSSGRCAAEVALGIALEAGYGRYYVVDWDEAFVFSSPRASPACAASATPRMPTAM